MIKIKVYKNLRVTKEQYDELKEMKIVKSESYDSVIERLIEEHKTR